MNRRTFLKQTAAVGGVTIMGPLHALGVRAAYGQTPPRVTGYGPLVPKGPELALPPEFNYTVISRQGQPMRDGFPTPGAFDGMGAFPGPQGTTILILVNETEFAGACFDPDGQTLYVNQYGARSAADTAPDLPFGRAGQGGVTYAIFGPFEKRLGDRSRNLQPAR